MFCESESSRNDVEMVLASHFEKYSLIKHKLASLVGRTPGESAFMYTLFTTTLSASLLFLYYFLLALVHSPLFKN